MPSLQPYPSYFPVAYDYAERLPVGWKLLPNIAIFEERIERGHDAEELLSVTIGRGVIKQTDVDIKKDNSNEDKSKYKLVKQGDIAYNKMRMWQGALGYSQYKGIASPAYVILKPKQKINARFFHYMFRSGFYTNYSRRHSYGIVDDQLNLRYTDFKRMYSILPPLNVQNAIVEYLDRKNEAIEQFIRNKERLIELLEMQRQNKIREAVTKGISNIVQFKDSHVDWIGKVPFTWDVKKIKYCADIIYGISPHESTYNDKGEGSILVNGPVEYSESDFGYTRELKWTTDPKKFAPQGALLFCLRGSTTGRLNICHADVSIGRGVAAIISKKNQDFMIYAIKALVDFISDSFKGSTFPSVTSNDLNNYLVPIPPTFDEQQAIVNFLKEEDRTFDLAIQKIEKEIASIKEYRESIITAAVTGQHDITIQIPDK
ncbi:MAG: restriction endonuclease subunit S [Saprospiraceae bacterium]|nr:restriction endonuclease subunit S [Saprospiraceae bacterium]